MKEKKSKNLRLALRAARHAGAITLSHYGNLQSITEKHGDKGLVTEADVTSEQAIVEILSAKTDYNIIAEESGKKNKESKWQWIVDPLDGTTNFARGIPPFAVSIALMKDGKALVGVTYLPITDECFFAERQCGAHMNHETIAVSKTAFGKNSLIVVNHGYAERDQHMVAHVMDVLPTGVRKFGSACYGFCMVANGTADAVVCAGLEVWDMAAGIALIKEAGGKVTDWKGKPWDGVSGQLIASNGRVHEELVHHLRKIR